MEQKYSRILVGMDGSAESLKAFDEAVRVAKRNDAELILANVIEKRSFLAVNTYDTIAEEQHENGTKLLLQQFAKEALDEGLTNVINDGYQCLISILDVNAWYQKLWSRFVSLLFKIIE